MALLNRVGRCTALLGVLLAICIVPARVVVAYSFPNDDNGKSRPEYQRLADAIRSGDLEAAQSAEQDVNIPRLRDFEQFLLNEVSTTNQHVVRYFRDRYKLQISDLKILVVIGDREGVADYLVRNEGITVSTEAGPVKLRPLVSIPGIQSPLRMAIHRNDAAMVKLLLEHGAAPHESWAGLGSSYARDDPTPLKTAIHIGNPEIVKLLLEAGAAVQEATSVFVPLDSHREAYWAGIWTGTREEQQRRHDEWVAAGWLKEEDVMGANEFGPMATAIRAGRAQIVELLLHAGADPNVSIGGKTTPLHLAVESGHPGIVKLLIDAGADINKPNVQGRTPLDVGFYRGDIADLLIAAGAKHQGDCATLRGLVELGNAAREV